MKNRIAKIKICLICGIETLRLGVHIKSHDISNEEYYRTYVSKLDNDTCQNKGCFNLVKFQNLNIGYTKYCSTRCSMVDRNLDRDFKKSLSNRMRTYSFSEEGILSSEKTRAKRSKSTFITKSLKKNWDKGLFYLMEFPGYIKIGVCAKDENLINLNKRCYILKPNTYTVFEGSIEEVASYEYYIKTSYLAIKDTEYFETSLAKDILINIPKNIILFLHSIKRPTTIL